MGKITINELHNSLFDYVQTVSDNKLETNNKTIVGAINELFSDNSNDIEINNLKNEISNGKKLIADAIGEPLTEEDAFTEMSTDINSLLSQFKTNMMNNGITVESRDKFKSLIDKIATLADNEGKGVQVINGNISECSNYYTFGSEDYYYMTLDYVPTIIYISTSFNQVYGSSMTLGTGECTVVYNSLDDLGINISITGNTAYGNICEIVPTVSSDGVYYFPIMPYINEKNTVNKLTECKYTIITVGEEDTTLRDSLADILQDEGVEVTPEDDMASLIIKTDNEFQENTTILYNKMKDANYNVDSSMNMDALLNELTFKTIIEGKVTQSPSTSENSLVYSVSGLDFTPSLVYVTLGGVYEQSDEIESVYYKSIILNNRQSFVGASEYNTIKVNIKNNGFNLILNSQDGGTYTGLGWTSINGISYMAIR